MRIIISQEGKKLNIEFKNGSTVDKYTVDKAEEFLVCLDKLFKKRNNVQQKLRIQDLQFENTGLLTERVVRAIMLGICF